MVPRGRNMQGQEGCSSAGCKIILSLKRRIMAENELEKNVRKEMDEFKVHPSEEVWPKIEERIRERKRKRRILFFILFSSIALMLGGYSIYNYNFSVNKTESELGNKTSKDSQPSDENKTGTSNK